MLRWRRIEISGGFLLLWAILYYLDDQGVVLWAILAAVLHELGHYAAIQAFGGRIALIRLTCTGAEMVLAARRPLSKAGQLCAALAGPAVNLILAALSARAAVVWGETAYLFAGLNLALAIFNLLPVEQLDGGRVFHIIMTLLLPEYWALRMTRMLSLGIAVALTLLGAVLVLQRGGSFTLLLTALWLLGASGTSQKAGESFRRKRRKICLHLR